MATETTTLTSSVFELHSGDRMSQAEFHRRYQRMPEDFHAELVGGTVYVSSPMKRPHGASHPALSTLLFTYEAHTPGVETGDNATILLGDEAEPQPDAYLRILEEFGGRSRVTPDDYIAGPPELLTEIAHSTQTIDLHAKRTDYARYGVLEYLVVTLHERRLRWFDLLNDSELSPNDDGVFRIHSFPGLWIHGEALLARDYKRMMDVLQQGLQSADHAEFVQQLRERTM